MTTTWASSLICWPHHTHAQHSMVDVQRRERKRIDRPIRKHRMGLHGQATRGLGVGVSEGGWHGACALTGWGPCSTRCWSLPCTHVCTRPGTVWYGVARGTRTWRLRWSRWVGGVGHAHTHTHTHTRARTHARALPLTHALTHARAHTHTSPPHKEELPLWRRPSTAPGGHCSPSATGAKAVLHCADLLRRVALGGVESLSLTRFQFNWNKKKQGRSMVSEWRSSRFRSLRSAYRTLAVGPAWGCTARVSKLPKRNQEDDPPHQRVDLLVAQGCGC